MGTFPCWIVWRKHQSISEVVEIRPRRLFYYTYSISKLWMAARHKIHSISSQDIDPVLAEYSGRCTKCCFDRTDKGSSSIHWNSVAIRHIQARSAGDIYMALSLNPGSCVPHNEYKTLTAQMMKHKKVNTRMLLAVMWSAMRVHDNFLWQHLLELNFM